MNGSDRLLNSVVRFRWWGLGLALLFSLLAWGPASRLTLDESIESFYAPDDPLLIHYLQSKADFGGDEFVMVGYRLSEPINFDADIEREPQKGILDRLAALSEKLSEVPGVNAASTQDISRILHNEAARSLAPIGSLRLSLVVKQMVEPGYQILISRDHTVLTVLLRLDDEAQAPISRRETFAQIRRLAQEFDRQSHVAGEPVQVHDMFRYVEADGWILGTTSSLLLMVVILIMFRSLRWVVLPILVVQLTLLWTRALLQVSGLQLSMVSSMLTSLVTIIAVATVMHITVTYRELRRNKTREQSLLTTTGALWLPILWTCLTTAVGFGSLLTSGITPVRSFGIMMGMGTLLVPVACLLVLPAGILWGTWDTDPRPVFAEKWLMQRLENMAEKILSLRIPILMGSALLSLVAFLGLQWMTVETDFSKNFRSQSDIVQALKFYESSLGGVGTWEVGFPAPHELTEEYVDEVGELAEELAELELPDGTRLTRVVSLAEGIDAMRELRIHKRGPFGFPNFARRDFNEARDALHQIQPEMEPSLYNSEQGRMRIMLRALEQQPAEKKLKLIAKVEELANQRFPEARATGLYVLLAELISSLLRDQLTSFLITSTAIALLMGLAFRSPWIGLISLVPNVLPILVVIGGMGWLGIPINIGTAMIASVSMGLTIDNSIHYLTGYTRRRKAGVDHVVAIRETHADVGRALIFANIALVLGFTVLTLSQFIPLIYFGVLVSVAMVGGLIGNLVLLPALLGFTESAKGSESPAGVHGQFDSTES